MRAQGIGANIMSLGGIAIAIGAMVDAAIVMIENMHKHLERAGPHVDRWAVARASAVEVGRRLFFPCWSLTLPSLPVSVRLARKANRFPPLPITIPTPWRRARVWPLL